MTGRAYRSFDGAVLYPLADGRCIRVGRTGVMLLTRVGGAFVRYLDSGRFVR